MTTKKLEIDIDQNNNITVSDESLAIMLQSAYADGRASSYHMASNEHYGTETVSKLFKELESQEYNRRIENVSKGIANLKQSFEEMRKILDSLED
jgi:hypothetical protein